MATPHRTTSIWFVYYTLLCMKTGVFRHFTRESKLRYRSVGTTMFHFNERIGTANERQIQCRTDAILKVINVN